MFISDKKEQKLRSNKKKWDAFKLLRAKPPFKEILREEDHQSYQTMLEREALLDDTLKILFG